MAERFLSDDSILIETNPYTFVMGHPVGFQPIHKGSTMECLTKIRKSAEELRYFHAIVHDLKTSSGAAKRTVYHWFEGDRRPTGMNLLHVWYFLSNRSCEIEGLENLDKNFRLLMEYLVSKKITPKRMAKLLNLPNQKTLFEMFDGERKIDRQTERRAKLLCRLLWREECNIMESDSDLTTLVAEGLLEPEDEDSEDKDSEDED